MAKSNLDLRGAKAPKLELDVLRLIVAVRDLRKDGNSAEGYVLVLHQRVQNRVGSWLVKYGALDCIICECGDLHETERADVIAEKERNAGAARDAVRTNKRSRMASANRGRDLGEAALERSIRSKEQGVIALGDRKKSPLSIDWDFFGTIDDIRSVRDAV
ncbi:MAG: hypothetical protein ABI120_09040 [Gemmatimonadaceae bacterium]